MALSIRKADIVLEIESIPAKLEIRTKAATLELKQKHAEIKIDAELPKVKIDQYECFAEAGLKNNQDLLWEMSRLAEKQILEYIAKVAEDGDRLAAIEYGGNPIADIAERVAFPEKEFGMATIPKSRPAISMEGSLTIEHEGNQPGMWNWVKGNYIGAASSAGIPAKLWSVTGYAR
jgi:hypothetical protein